MISTNFSIFNKKLIEYSRERNLLQGQVTSARVTSGKTVALALARALAPPLSLVNR